MDTPNITPAEQRMLEELAAAFPELVRDAQQKMVAAQAAQQKIMANATMFQAYGWPIPQVEGVVIQQAVLTPAAAQALNQAMQQTQPAPIVIPPPATPPPPPSLKAERGSVRKFVNQMLLTGGDMSTSELRDAIQKKHHVTLGMSSIYRILADKTQYENVEGKWRVLL